MTMQMVPCTVLVLLVYSSTVKTSEARYYGSDESPEQYGYANYDRSSEEGYGEHSINDDIHDVSLELGWNRPKLAGKTPCAPARMQSRRYKRMNAPNGCEWDKAIDLPQNYPPIILRTCSNRIVLPERVNGRDKIRVASGTFMSISCPAGEHGNTPNAFINRILNGQQNVRVQCVNGAIYDVLTNVLPNQAIPMSITGCTQKIKSRIYNDPQGCGLQNCNQLMYIGFDSIDANGNDYFYPQIKVCRDQNRETTLWTEHILHGANIIAKDSGGNHAWIQFRGMFSTNSMEDVYKITSQQTYLMNIQPGNDYFARGHLSPAGDFVTQAEIGATYYHINAVPQWQEINNGNWGKVVEHSIRTLAAGNNGGDLRIITGIIGILKDNNGNDMYLIDTNPKAIGMQDWLIPLALWKIVINQNTNQGIAFVVSNDPITVNPTGPTQPSICNLLRWGNFGGLNQQKEKGYTYCFTLRDFSNAFPTLMNTLPNNINFNLALLN